MGRPHTLGRDVVMSVLGTWCVFCEWGDVVGRLNCEMSHGVTFAPLSFGVTLDNQPTN